MPGLSGGGGGGSAGKSAGGAGFVLVPEGPIGGTSVASSATANTYGSWTELEAATAEALYIVGVLCQRQADAFYAQVQIGVGAAAAEAAVSTVKFNAAQAATASGSHVVPLPFPVPVASGERISARLADEDAVAQGSNISLLCVAQSDLGSL